MFYKSMFFKQSVLFLSIFAVSGGATMFMLYEKSTHNQVDEPEVSTPGGNNGTISPAQALIGSVMSYKSMDIDGNINVREVGDTFNAKLDIKGAVDISDLSALKLNADVDVTASGAHFATGVTFYSEKFEDDSVKSTMYVDYNDSHLKLSDAKPDDFISMLPTMGGIELPPELANIDFTSFASEIMTIVPEEAGQEDSVDSNGLKKYVFKLPPLIEGLDLYLKSDADWNFEGAMSNDFVYNGFVFKLDFDIKGHEQAVEVPNPAKGQFGERYQDFTPAVNLVPGLSNLFKQEQTTIGLDIDMTLPTTPEKPEAQVISLNSDISFDNPKAIYSIDASIKENKRDHQFKIGLKDGKMFLNQADVNKVSFSGETLTSFGNYIIKQCSLGSKGQLLPVLDNIALIANSPKVDNVINKIKEVAFGTIGNHPEYIVSPTEEEKAQAQANSDDILNTLISILDKIQDINSWLTQIEVVGNKTIIHLNLTQFGLTASDIQIAFETSNKEFAGLEVSNLDVNGTGLNIKLAPKAFNLFEVKEDQLKDYIPLDPALTWTPSILQLASKYQFRFLIEGKVTDTSMQTNPTTINGGFQFNLKESKYGYGDLHIVDSNTWTHDITADLRADNKLLVKYNTMKAWLTTDKILDMGSTISELLKGADAGFNEAFAAVLGGLSDTPISQAMKGDIGAILTNDAFIIKEVLTDNGPASADQPLAPIKALTLSINGKMMGLENTFIDIKITSDKGDINGIEIPNLSLDGGVTKINMKLKIKDFDNTLQDKRLEFKTSEFLNLNDLNLLLKMGIKTTTFKYYQLHAGITLKIIGIPINLTLDAKVENLGGKLRFAGRITDIPCGIAVTTKHYDNLNSRIVNILYEGGDINRVYIQRDDIVSDTILNLNKRTIVYKTMTTGDKFTKNLKYYLCDVAIGFSDLIMNAINKPVEPDPNAGQQKPYEKILSSFGYIDGGAGKASQFDVGLDLTILTGNKYITDTVVSIYTDANKTYLDKISLKAKLFAGIMGLSADINLVSHDQVLDFSEIDTFKNENPCLELSDGDVSYIYRYQGNKLIKTDLENLY